MIPKSWLKIFSKSYFLGKLVQALQKEAEVKKFHKGRQHIGF